MSSYYILIVDDDKNDLSSLDTLLQEAGYETRSALSDEEALQAMAERPPDLVIYGPQTPGGNEDQFLGLVKRLYPDTVRVISACRKDIDAAVSAISRSLAHHAAIKPWDSEELKRTVARALRERALALEERRLGQKTASSYANLPTTVRAVEARTASLPPSASPAVLAPQPQSLAALGVSPDLVSELALKEIYFAGRATAMEVNHALAIAFSLTQSILDFMKRESLVRVAGSQGPLPHWDELVLTDRGRKRAEEALSRSRYRGPVPVPLDQYCEVVKAQSLSGEQTISREELQRGLSHLVLKHEVIDLLGPAVRANESIFLYGPPGNGKTTIASSLGRILGEALLVPHAVYVGGHIVKVFDPIVHMEATPEKPGQEVGSQSSRQHHLVEPVARRDERWVLCHRPTITAGGELTLDRLELEYDENLGYYQAPLQMKANGGILVIDDFGRQSVSPKDILNRWVVPMDRGVDYLHLRGGETIEVPFNLLLVFATNLHPADLLDEALLRRLQYKVFIPDPSEDEFREIFRRAAADNDLTIEEGVLDYFISRYYRDQGRPMRGYHPGALIRHANDIRLFRNRSDALSREILDLAASALFVAG